MCVAPRFIMPSTDARTPRTAATSRPFESRADGAALSAHGKVACLLRIYGWVTGQPYLIRLGKGCRQDGRHRLLAAGARITPSHKGLPGGISEITPNSPACTTLKIA